MQRAEQVDISTLAWIKGELEETLKEARAALEAFSEAPGDTGPMEACVDAIRRVRGTLQMVELAAATRFVAEAEALADAIRQATLEEERLEVAEEALMRALLQLPDYLEGLQSGRPDNLLPLLPLFNEMRQLRDEKPVAGLSVFQPDLNVEPPHREGSGSVQAVAHKARPYYQTALAHLLRDKDIGASLTALHKVLDALFKVADERPVRQAFWAALGVVEALREGGLGLTREIKQLLGKLEQLVKFLAQNGEAAVKAEQAQALTRVLLYEVGRATSGSAVVTGLKEAFGLDAFFAEQGGAGFGGLNSELKKTVAADIMEELSGIKDTLDVFVRGQRDDLGSLAPIADGLQRLAETLDLLRQDELQQAVETQVAVLDRLASGELAPEDDVLMGVAGALLLVESTLQDWGSNAPVEKADEAHLAGGQGAPEAEHLRGVRQVMKEALADLVQVREILADFLDSGDREKLDQLPDFFHRLTGSLNVLSYLRVARVLQACAAFVQEAIVEADTVPADDRLDRLADAVMSVEYYLEAFVQSRVHPASVLDVAEDALRQLGYPVEAAEASEEPAPPLETAEAAAQDEPLTPVVEADADAIVATPGVGADAEEIIVEPVADPDAGESAVASVPAAEPEATVDAEPESESVPEAGMIAGEAPAEDGDDDEDLDDEITAVFLEEAQEELEKIAVLLPKWESNPGDSRVLSDYRRSFHTLKGSGRLVGAAELGEFAWSVENMLNRVMDGTVEPGPTMFELLHRAEPAVQQLVEQFKTGKPPELDIAGLAAIAEALSRGESPALPEPTEAVPTETSSSPASDEAETVQPTEYELSADPELLEIYGKEAADHLAAIEAFLDDYHSSGVRQVSEPVVRALHTLKGSSRIAGVTAIATVAEALEKYAKALQSAHHSMDDEGIAVLAESAALVRAVLDHLADPSNPLPRADALQERAGALYASVRHLEDDSRPDVGLAGSLDELSEADRPSEDEPAQDAAEPIDASAVELEEPELETIEIAAPEEPVDAPVEASPGDGDANGPSPAESGLDAPAERYEASEDRMGLALADDEEAELIDIFLEEAGEILDASERTLQAWADNPSDRSAIQELQRQLHTIKGSARLAGIAPVGDLSHQLESVFEGLVEGRIAASDTLLSRLQLAHDRLVEMLEQVRNREPVASGADLIAQIEAATKGEVSVEPEPEVTPELQESASAPDAEAEEEPELLDLFLEEGREILDSSERTLQSWIANPGDLSLVQALQRNLHTLKGSARMAGVTAVGDLSHALESTFEVLAEGRAVAGPELLDAVQRAHDRLAAMVDQVWNRQPVSSGEDIASQLNRLIRGESPSNDAEMPAAEVAEASVADTEQSPQESLSLIDTASEQAVRIGAELQAWQKQPAAVDRLEALMATLTALEESARAVDAKNIADIAAVTVMLLSEVRDGHVLVSDELLGLLHLVHERILVLAEQYQSGTPLRGVQDLIDSLKELIAKHTGGRTGREDEEESAEEANRRRSARIQHEMVRVRRDLMENLGNFAGEVSIYRSRVEQQLNSFRSNLNELDETVDRLRGQLRQFDIETEAQISARYQEAQQEYEEFDPLEFDRFTNMQQLSRAMMESLSDIRSIEEIMLDAARESETLLLQQARVNTELQETLMQTRMVQLVENAPRLRRIVRQTCADIGRKANLSFTGAEVEMDRRVVERLMAPLEHMLRNAVAHGIESPEERAAAGKDETGMINIAMAREGAEVVVRIKDDGRGIDVNAVRRKAVERGLMEPDADLDDREVMQFILESGFSTASTLTQVAGRGVGMDVVSSEVRQLSGSMDIDSTPGKGTVFTIRLPLSLSVSRALVVHVGEETFAIPLLSVQGIERVDRSELEGLLQQEHPTYSWLGDDYDLMNLRQILGLMEAPNLSETSKQPLLLAQSGEHRVALVVDRIAGSREVVIKSLGPQLSTLQSLSGATILADGSVALVLELPALIRRGVARRHAVETVSADAQPKERTPTVMIVDDSITVRAVTKRLLKRHGMNAVAAKDGVDALALLEETMPDVMLLDIEMPRMDGFELATHIRNADNLKHLPIIMITSRTGDKHRQRAMDIGVDVYMGKPYAEGELMENIEGLVARQRQGQTDR